jgi:hypothetical protein
MIVGLVWVTIPIVVAVAGFGFVPSLSHAYITVLLVIFFGALAISQLWGLRKLAGVCNRAFDLVTIVSIAAFVLVIAVLGAFVWVAMHSPEI